MPTVNAKHLGAWKNATNVWAKHDGAWLPWTQTKGYAKHDGAWVQIWPSGSPFELIRTVEVTTPTKSVMIDKCFSEDYRNYVILFETTAATASCAYRLAKWSEAQGKSIPNVENVYTRQQINANGSNAVVGVRATETWAHCFSAAGTTKTGYEMTFYGPYEDKPTASRSVSAWDSFSARILDYACTHNKAESFDGIEFIQTNDTATIAGTFTIYGVRS